MAFNLDSGVFWRLANANIENNRALGQQIQNIADSYKEQKLQEQKDAKELQKELLKAQIEAQKPLSDEGKFARDMKLGFVEDMPKNAFRGNSLDAQIGNELYRFNLERGMDDTTARRSAMDAILTSRPTVYKDEMGNVRVNQRPDLFGTIQGGSGRLQNQPPEYNTPSPIPAGSPQGQPSEYNMPPPATNFPTANKQGVNLDSVDAPPIPAGSLNEYPQPNNKNVFDNIAEANLAEESASLPVEDQGAYQLASKTSGLRNTVKAKVGNIIDWAGARDDLSQLGVIDPNLGNEENFAMTNAKKVTNKIVEALQTSPLFAQAERKQLEEDFGINPSIFGSEEAMKIKYVAVRDALQSRLDMQNRVLNDPTAGKLKENALLNKYALEEALKVLQTPAYFKRPLPEGTVEVGTVNPDGSVTPTAKSQPSGTQQKTTSSGIPYRIIQ